MVPYQNPIKIQVGWKEGEIVLHDPHSVTVTFCVTTLPQFGAGP